MLYRAVTELVEGDSSRKIVVERVGNMQKTVAKFEEHRETVKLNASKLANKHARYFLKNKIKNKKFNHSNIKKYYIKNPNSKLNILSLNSNLNYT